ncbi:hypothetical protein PoB_004806200 [Plakobranchus ocellatus]|uniref:Uncharacterized protein n=1 Tax=Plakobranchus ocellatus TaxID=259542 RepID=A0AAV4BRE1_9GAST|nr:hypothetical protein PoB_004806200 [Plakobranchus ocellatus]
MTIGLNCVHLMHFDAQRLQDSPPATDPSQEKHCTEFHSFARASPKLKLFPADCPGPIRIRPGSFLRKKDHPMGQQRSSLSHVYEERSG